MIDMYAIAKDEARLDESQCLVHDVSYPLKVCMCSITQLTTLINCLAKTGKTVLHVDSTGSVVRPVDKAFKTVYYYAGCVNFSGKVLSVMDFVSVQHDITTVTSFFSNVLLFKKKITARNLFSHIVIDFSQVLLHSVINAWCKTTIEMYLRRMFSFATKQRTNVKHATVHLCCSNFMHMVSGDLKKINVNGPLKNFCLQAMAVLLTCAEFDKFQSKVRHILNICLSPNQSMSVLDSISTIDDEITVFNSNDITNYDNSIVKENFPL